MEAVAKITFPKFSGVQCLMMPYIQGDPTSVPDGYRAYGEILESVFLQSGEIGFLTIDESPVIAGTPHRGSRAKFGRALHTEAGQNPLTRNYRWGGGTWGGREAVTLDPDLRVLIASNLDDSCAVWDAEHNPTSLDGDIGFASVQYPYTAARFLKAGDVCNIGILTPHESIPVKQDGNRQFLRIVGAGVYGREEYFSVNPKVPARDAGFLARDAS